MIASELIKVNNVTGPVLLQPGRTIVTAARAFVDTAAADIFLQMFDAASAADVTLGTTLPDWVVTIDSAASPVSSGDGLSTNGDVFYKGVVVACTTTPVGAVTSAAHVRVAIL